MPRDEMTPRKLLIQRMEAQEYRRRLAQGLGRPIISFEKDGSRYIQVGNQLQCSPNWKTFPDFLFDYIKQLFTSDWGNSELKKTDENAHPLIIWFRKLGHWQREIEKNAKSDIYMYQPIGAARAYLGLAYDLYLCAHNATIQEKLMSRLRNKNQFEGAAYEAFVVGTFIKAGYSIEFEDEQDESRSHCEFTATHLVTGRNFSVEAKAIQSTGSRAGSAELPPRMGARLSNALKKQADFERIIFLDLSRAENFADGQPPAWVEQVEKDIANAESWSFDGVPAPPAYLFITNSGYLHALDSTTWSELKFITGFKIDDFPVGRKPSRILDFVRARERHIEIVWLHEALEKHKTIPSTFDGSSPEEAFANEQLNRPRIGDEIVFTNENGDVMSGRLINAQVDSRRSEVFAEIHTTDGRVSVGTFPLTEAELAAYKRQPDTFFEIVKPVSREPNTPLDWYDFLWDTYQHSTCETLKSFMHGWPGENEHSSMSQRELAEKYCEELATQMWQDSQRQANKKATI